MTTVQTPVSVQPETSRYAITAMVWALVGLWAPIPFLFPLMALSFAASTQSHIQENPGRIKGRELAQAARAVAWFMLAVWLVVSVLAAVAFVIYAVGGNGS